MFKTPYFILIIITATFLSCNNNNANQTEILKGEKETSTNKEAKIASDYIIDNLENPIVFEKFSDDHLNKIQVTNTIKQLIENCDWGNKYGGYKKYYSSGDRAAFVYNYKLLCGSFKITLIFGLNFSEPQLLEFRISPIKNAQTPNLKD